MGEGERGRGGEAGERGVCVYVCVCVCKTVEISDIAGHQTRGEKQSGITTVESFVGFIAGKQDGLGVRVWMHLTLMARSTPLLALSGDLIRREKKKPPVKGQTRGKPGATQWRLPMCRRTSVTV